MVVTLTSSGACLVKAGTNVSNNFRNDGTPSADERWTELINQAEDRLSVATRKDWVTAYDSLKPNTKKILDGIVSDWAAGYAINHDMSGYTSRSETRIMLNFLDRNALMVLSILRDKKKEDFMG